MKVLINQIVGNVQIFGIKIMNFFKDFKKSGLVTSIIDMANKATSNKSPNEHLNNPGHIQPKYQRSSSRNSPPKAINSSNIPERIWKTAEPSNHIFYPEINAQDALQFLKNIIQFKKEQQRNQTKRINKMKREVMNDISVEPIYMHTQEFHKILSMELETNHSQMQERNQYLREQKQAIEIAVGKLLHLKQLWGIKDDESTEIGDLCLRQVVINLQRVEVWVKRITERRVELMKINCYISKLKQLNRKREEIKKKISLIKMLKQKNLKNSVASIKFQNIDQAFYVQRQRQKLYYKLVSSGQILSKINLFQDLHRKIHLRNKQLIQICSKYCLIWSQSNLSQDPTPNKKIEKKHKEKLLILIYFIKTQKMYTQSQLLLNLYESIAPNSTPQMIKQLQSIKQWSPNDFKYVNSSSFKNNIILFLDTLIIELRSPKSTKKRGIFLESRNK